MTPGPKPKPLRHGTRYAYVRGCRCDACTTANRMDTYAARRLYRRQEKDPNDPRHGSINFYRNYGCRCDRCRAANSAQCKAYQERRKAAAA